MTSLAKLSAPGLARVFVIERLFEALDAARDARVVWIGGAPGAGKTTLAASYVKARRQRTLWYRMDDDDRDATTFFYGLALAAQDFVPSKTPLPLLTPEYRRGMAAFARRFFQRLFERAPVASVMVFDDYHTVPPDSDVHELLASGLAEVPEHVSVIVLSRAEPPMSFSRLRANGSLRVLPPEDLRLIAEEVAGIVCLRRRSNPGEHEIVCLTERTQGWAAGVVLLVESSPSTRAAPASFDLQTPHAMFDYFAEEVLLRLEQDQREVLLKTAVLPATTAAIATELTGIRGAAETLPGRTAK